MQRNAMEHFSASGNRVFSIASQEIDTKYFFVVISAFRWLLQNKLDDEIYFMDSRENIKNKYDYPSIGKIKKSREK